MRRINSRFGREVLIIQKFNWRRIWIRHWVWEVSNQLPSCKITENMDLFVCFHASRLGIFWHRRTTRMQVSEGFTLSAVASLCFLFCHIDACLYYSRILIHTSPKHTITQLHSPTWKTNHSSAQSDWGVCPV